MGATQCCGHAVRNHGRHGCRKRNGPKGCGCGLYLNGTPGIQDYRRQYRRGAR